MLLFLLSVCLFIFSSAGITPSYTWETLSIEKTSLFSIVATSKDELYAAATDEKLGSVLLYSSNQGKSWKIISTTMGNNFDLAISRNHEFLCGIGTKSYCFHLSTLHSDDYNSETRLSSSELHLRASPRDIQPLNDRGFGIVGLFKNLEGQYINGVAISRDLTESVWEYYDIGLKQDEGYYVNSGSFPSNTTYYITSGSWPLQNQEISTILSGKINMIPGNTLGTYNYEFLSLNLVRPDRYVGAISKTIDGGKTWKKVFDSSNNFYFNEISCYDEYNCIALGEGSFVSLALHTEDGGNSWKRILELSGEYSLHSIKMISSTEYWISGGKKVDKDEEDVGTSGEENVGVKEEAARIEETGRNLRRKLFKDEETGASKGGKSENDKNEKYIGLYYHSIDNGETWEQVLSKDDGGYAYSMYFYDQEVGYASTISSDHCGVSRLST
jgi:hypothetical protein